MGRDKPSREPIESSKGIAGAAISVEQLQASATAVQLSLLRGHPELHPSVGGCGAYPDVYERSSARLCPGTLSSRAGRMPRLAGCARARLCSETAARPDWWTTAEISLDRRRQIPALLR